MYISWCFIAALLSSSALADCPNGPYSTNSECPGKCYGFQRCGDYNQVIRCETSVGGGTRWIGKQWCKHCKWGGCDS
ncbi:unnamed protein product [Alternaria burnsii]|nr:unnamed protein product [Alternaria burnsii]